jgi:hypothetical protein
LYIVVSNPTSVEKMGIGPLLTLEAVLCGEDVSYKLREVARHFDIPSSSLSDHACGKIVSRKRGKEGVLGMEEEGLLV